MEIEVNFGVGWWTAKAWFESSLFATAVGCDEAVARANLLTRLCAMRDELTALIEREETK